MSYKECQGKEFPHDEYAAVHKVSVKSVYLIWSIINYFYLSHSLPPGSLYVDSLYSIDMC